MLEKHEFQLQEKLQHIEDFMAKYDNYSEEQIKKIKYRFFYVKSEIC